MTKAEAASKAIAANPVFIPKKTMKYRVECTHLGSLIDGLTTQVENFSLTH